MKAKTLTRRNFRTGLTNPDDTVPVVGKHYNDLLDDMVSVMPELGHLKMDEVTEFTSESGTTIEGIKIKDSIVYTDTVSEKTAAAGVILDSVTLKDGIVGKRVAVTSTVGGLTGTSALSAVDQFVTITSSSANKIVTLPAISATTIGLEIRGYVGTNGCELRWVGPTGTTFNNVAGLVNMEAAIPADYSFVAKCIDTAKWLLNAWNHTGTAVVIIPDV
jgi:hypothetical protein